MVQIPKKPEESLFTNSQWQAMHASGQDILVSASAGSGKTLVLINRLVRKILAGLPVDELLVVTFTNAAAREMKERLQKELQNEISKLDNYEDFNKKQHLFQQIPKVNQAYISTIHSFCLKVIQNYYYLIDFDPVFRQLTDDTEIEMIKEDIWEEVFEEFLKNASTKERYFALAYSGKRSDESLQQMVFKLLSFARSRPDTEKWLKSLPDLYLSCGDSLTGWSFYQENIYPEMMSQLDYAIKALEKALAMDDGAKELKTPRSRLEADFNQINKIKNLIETGDLSEAYKQSEYNFKRWGNGAGDYKEVGKAMKPYREQAKEVYNELVADYFSISPEEQINAVQNSGQMIAILADLTLEFSERYQSYKADRQLIDFNDLEHLTLAILQNEDGSPSEAALYYRDLFSEIMVDEYQDTNVLQEKILQLVSRKEPQSNLFMVGDIKQSIYSFRLADPTLFADKYERFAKSDDGERIDLLENFRSRPEVLAFTNQIFAQMMDRELGDIDYDQFAALKFGLKKKYEPNESFETEVLLFNGSEQDGDMEDELKSKEGEIHMVASRIQELVNSEEPQMIYDSDEEKERPTEFRDIVLLTPTKNNNALIQEIFQQYQIPVNMNETQNFFQTTEISIIMSLLEIIDNPVQDIPLIAVLRSPIVGLKENALAQIRLQDRSVSYYQAMLQFNHAHFEDPRNQASQRKVRFFLEQLQSWREKSNQLSVADLLRQIYRETGYEIYVAGMPGGQQRQANLRALIERASSYEKTSFKGLTRFIHFVDIMRDKDKDLAEPTSAQMDKNAVRVMTIHASKGLEFPLVFVMDMSRHFNLDDATKNPYVFDSDYGIGLEWRDLDRHLRVPTYPEVFLRDQKKQKLIAEEMRVLYVAFTRAEQKLFLVGQSDSFASAEKEWEQSDSVKDIKIPTAFRLSKNNYMYWIALAKHRQAELKAFLNKSDPEMAQLMATDFHIKVCLGSEISPPSKESVEADQVEILEQIQRDKNLMSDESLEGVIDFAKHVLGYEYPHFKATQLKSNASVTELKRVFEDPDFNETGRIDLSEWDDDRVNQKVINPLYHDEVFESPRFTLHSESEKADALAIGQATHLLLQTIPLDGEMCEDKFMNYAKNLADKQLIPINTLDHIPYQLLSNFFKTEFGHFILENKKRLIREAPFTMMIPAAKIYSEFKETGDDQVLVHGVIDGYIEENEGIVLFDYKTDRIFGAAEEVHNELIRRYQSQLGLYRIALEDSLNKPVKRSIIIGINAQMTIDI